MMSMSKSGMNSSGAGMAGLGRMMVVLLLVVAGTSTLCSARPPKGPDANSDLPYMLMSPGETSQADSNILGSGMNDFRPDNSRFMRSLDDNALQQLFLQNQLFQLARLNGIRQPEEKRQIRYRQCYFNPISCFRK